MMMAIRLGTLYQQGQQNYQMRLIAGESGLDNIIKWVHMIEDETVAAFLRGNELVFTTGIGRGDAAWLTGFAQGLTRSKASGLVVNMGRYIHAVPEETVEYCKRTGLPLFTIPWHIRLVDVTRDFCRRIINSEQTEISVSSAFKNAVFFPDDLTRYQAQLERHGFNVNWSYCAAVLAVGAEPAHAIQEQLAAVRSYAENIVNRISDKYSIFNQDNCLIIIFAKLRDSEISACINRIAEYYQATEHCGYTLNIGIGQNESGLPALAKSYKQAASVLPMAAKNKWLTVYYKELGIYKLLLSTEDDQVLREIYNDLLGKLADYDAAYNTDYMDTLKCYLENDASVQAVSKLTYVHRNTINYKLRKIKEIMGCNIAGVEDRLKIMLAFKIKDIL